MIADESERRRGRRFIRTCSGRPGPAGCLPPPAWLVAALIDRFAGAASFCDLAKRVNAAGPSQAPSIGRHSACTRVAEGEIQISELVERTGVHPGNWPSVRTLKQRCAALAGFLQPAPTLCSGLAPGLPVSAAALCSSSCRASFQTTPAPPESHHADSLCSQQGGRGLVQRQAPGAAPSEPEASRSPAKQGQQVRM